MPHVTAAVDKWGDTGQKLGQAADGLNATLSIVNRPCATKGPDGKLLPDGPICQLDTAVHDLRKITTVAQDQVKQTGALIAATTRGMDGATADLHTAAGALTTAANAGTETLVQARDTLREDGEGLKGSLTALQGEIEGLQALTPPATKALTVLADTAEHLDGVAEDMHKVSDHFEQQIDHPAKMTAGQKARVALDVAWKALVLAGKFY
jgi:hypothetical protein